MIVHVIHLGGEPVGVAGGSVAAVTDTYVELAGLNGVRPDAISGGGPVVVVMQPDEGPATFVLGTPLPAASPGAVRIARAIRP